MTKPSLAIATAAVLIGLLAATGVKAADAARPTLTGAEIFAKNCSYCHAPGDEHAGTRQLRDTRGEAFAVLQQRTDLQADYVETIVRHGLNAMPPFKPTVITDAELDRLAAYLAKAKTKGRP
jgi:mono/diheme cytochrome c family protein